MSIKPTVAKGIMECLYVNYPYCLCNIYRDRHICGSSHVIMREGPLGILHMNISHVSSWPQSPEAHSTDRELFLPLCHALPLLWWSVWQFLHFLNTISHGCWGSYTEMKTKSIINNKNKLRNVAKTGIICHLQVSFGAKHI